MKKLPVILMVTLFVHNQKAVAFSDSSLTKSQHCIKRLYGGFGIGTGFEGVGFAAAIGVIKNNNWGFLVSFLGNEYSAKNMPNDYKHPSGGFDLNLFGSSESPLNDLADILSVLVVKEFPSRFSRMRFDVAAGPSVGYHRKLEFISIPEERGSSYTFFSWYSGNYKINTLKRWSAGLSLKASMGFMPSKSFCLQLAAYANLNTQHSYAGLQLEFLFGKLREQLKRK